MVAASSAGHSGAAAATWEHVHRHFAVAALLVARNAAYPSGGPKIASHVDFDSTAAWRHHVSMPPSSRSQSAATTALTAGIGELFRVKRLREIPHWWILGRCGPPITRHRLGHRPRSRKSHTLVGRRPEQRPSRARPGWTRADQSASSPAPSRRSPLSGRVARLCGATAALAPDG